MKETLEPLKPSKMPVVNIEGREITMQRLGFEDALTLMNILGDHKDLVEDILLRRRSEFITLRKRFPDESDVGYDEQFNKLAIEIGFDLYKALMGSSKEFMQVIAGSLGITVDELLDRNKYPMPSIPAIIKGLATHPDIKETIKNFSEEFAGLNLTQMTASDSPNNSNSSKSAQA